MNYNKALDNGSGGPDEISDQQKKRKGFDGLALEDVATALIIPNFGKVFQQHTGLDWQALERLNRSKFDINWMARKDNSEHSALFINCSRGDLVKVSQYLKESKDPKIKQCVDYTKKSPLHVATIEGHLSIVEILLMSGFNTNCRDRTVKTPLNYGCLHGHETIVDTLLKAGADITARDSLDRSCIHFAASCLSAQTLQLVLATKPELSKEENISALLCMEFLITPSEFVEDISLLRLYINVVDYDYNSNNLLGKCEVDISKLKSGQWVNQRIPLFNERISHRKVRYISKFCLQLTEMVQLFNNNQTTYMKTQIDNSKRNRREQKRKRKPRQLYPNCLEYQGSLLYMPNN